MTSTPDADVAQRPAAVPQLESLTSMRFFAALVVVVHHAGWMATSSHAAYDVLEIGYIGVSFFFVLSGFVLTWSLSLTRTTRRFYWLRFARIWPLHAVTAAYAGLVLANQFWVPGAAGITAIFTCAHAFVTSKHTYYGLNGVSWSLGCEAFFYLLFPFAVRLLLGRSRRLLWTVVAVDVVAIAVIPWAFYTIGGPNGWAAQHSDWVFFINPAFRFGEFLLGVALGCLFRDGWRPSLPLGFGVFAATATTGVVAWLAVAHGIRTPRPYYAAAVVPWFGLIIAAASANDVTRRPSMLRSPTLVFLGEASFALYLTHQIVQRSFNWETIGSVRPGPSAVAFGCYLAVVIAVAAAAHRLFERPVERALRRLPVGSRPPTERIVPPATAVAALTQSVTVEDPGAAQRLTTRP